jgi:hypothetical protein
MQFLADTITVKNIYSVLVLYTDKMFLFDMSMNNVH